MVLAIYEPFMASSPQASGGTWWHAPMLKSEGPACSSARLALCVWCAPALPCPAGLGLGLVRPGLERHPYLCTCECH